MEVEHDFGERADGRELELSIKALVQAGFAVQTAAPRRAALDEVFRALTQPDPNPAHPTPGSDERASEAQASEAQAPHAEARGKKRKGRAQ
jgi:hypothetical protein